MFSSCHKSKTFYNLTTATKTYTSSSSLLHVRVRVRLNLPLKLNTGTMLRKFLLLALLLEECSTFPLHKTSGRNFQKFKLSRLKGSLSSDDIFPNFLNQCAIQSLLYLMVSLNDINTAIWLEDFTKPSIPSSDDDDEVLSNMEEELEKPREKNVKMLGYHGLGAINSTIFPTWDSFFELLLESPDERIIFPDYELEIKPASVCSRLISIREQIAREFARELDVLADISSDGVEYENLKQEQPGKRQYKTPLFFLDNPFDDGVPPSPLRTGNFDLLLLLTTQESIHRILNLSSPLIDEYEIDQSSLEFLRNFYLRKKESHFIGSKNFGRADDFMEQMLNTNDEEEYDLLDPIQIVDIILKEREQVATEWIDQALDVPKSHNEIKRWQLNRLMGIANYDDEESFQ